MYEPDFTYQCSLVTVIDGDTVVLLVDLGFRVQMELRVTLYDFAAPTPLGGTREEGLRYKARGEEWFRKHPGPFFITTYKNNIWRLGDDGRWLGRIFVNLPEDDDGRTAQEYLTDHLRIGWSKKWN